MFRKSLLFALTLQLAGCAALNPLAPPYKGTLQPIDIQSIIPGNTILLYDFATDDKVYVYYGANGLASNPYFTDRPYYINGNQLCQKTPRGDVCFSYFVDSDRVIFVKNPGSYSAVMGRLKGDPFDARKAAERSERAQAAMAQYLSTLAKDTRRWMQQSERRREKEELEREQWEFTLRSMREQR